MLWPILQVGVRRNSVTMPVLPFLLVDTGADSTLLHLQMAATLGLATTDLVEQKSSCAGGETLIYAPKDLGSAEICIGGHWFRLPSLKFGASLPMSLLGRDVIFSHFELRMTSGEIELRPLPRRII